jgi:chromate transporter
MHGMHALNITEWLTLFTQFLLFSLLSIGGAISVTPDMHRYLVVERGLLSDAQFSSSIAIAQASPGPNILFVALMGYQVSGFTGMLATFAGILIPSTTLALATARWSRGRQENTPSWHAVQAFKAGMAPITIALMAATGWILTANTSGGYSLPLVALTLVAALLVWRTKLHLLLLLGAGALVGMSGVL